MVPGSPGFEVKNVHSDMFACVEQYTTKFTCFSRFPDDDAKEFFASLQPDRLATMAEELREEMESQQVVVKDGGVEKQDGCDDLKANLRKRQKTGPPPESFETYDRHGLATRWASGSRSQKEVLGMAWAMALTDYMGCCHMSFACPE